MEIRCHTTNKHCYTSQAKALRAIHNFKNLKRSYFCDDCGYWHNTKMGTSLAVMRNIIEPQKKKMPITNNKLQKRLDFLLKSNQ